MFAVTILIGVFGLFLARLFTAGLNGALGMMVLGLALMGIPTGRWGRWCRNCSRQRAIHGIVPGL